MQKMDSRVVLQIGSKWWSFWVFTCDDCVSEPTSCNRRELTVIDAASLASLATSGTTLVGISLPGSIWRRAVYWRTRSMSTRRASPRSRRKR